MNRDRHSAAVSPAVSNRIEVITPQFRPTRYLPASRLGPKSAFRFPLRCMPLCKAHNMLALCFHSLTNPSRRNLFISHPYKTPGVTSDRREPFAFGEAKSFFVPPLFSYSYELLFPQALYFDNHPHCRGVWGLDDSAVPPLEVVWP